MFVVLSLAKSLSELESVSQGRKQPSKGRRVEMARLTGSYWGTFNEDLKAPFVGADEEPVYFSLPSFLFSGVFSAFTFISIDGAISSDSVCGWVVLDAH